MTAKDQSLDADDVIELEDDLDEIDPDDVEEEIALATEDEVESGEASLEELLAARTAARRGTDEADDEDDIMALASEPDIPVLEPLPTTVVPIKDQQEFVCKNCHLVKARVQLADEARGLCRDCV